MTRFRITATITREYDVCPSCYPDPNPESMRAMDLEIIQDDPMIMLDHPDAKWDIKVEDITNNS